MIRLVTCVFLSFGAGFICLAMFALVLDVVGQIAGRSGLGTAFDTLISSDKTVLALLSTVVGSPWGWRLWKASRQKQ
jgi:hypothetical protein